MDTGAIRHGLIKYHRTFFPAALHEDIDKGTAKACWWILKSSTKSGKILMEHALLEIPIGLVAARESRQAATHFDDCHGDGVEIVL